MGNFPSSTFNNQLRRDSLDDILFYIFPELAEFDSSDEMFRISPGYFSYLSSIQLLSSCLSVPCIIYNIILLLVIQLDENFSSWQFFPIMLQCGIDAIGPGLANIIYNYQMRSKSGSMKIIPSEFEIFQNKLLLQASTQYVRYNGYEACFLTYLREHLNELTTGICVCATGLYRYLLVCHPTYKVEDNFYKKGAVIIVSFVVLGLIAISIDFAFNEGYDFLLTETNELKFPIIFIFQNANSIILKRFA